MRGAVWVLRSVMGATPVATSFAVPCPTMQRNVAGARYGSHTVRTCYGFLNAEELTEIRYTCSHYTEQSGVK